MLSGNSLRQTVHTHRASVYQAAKLAAALLRAAGVTAGLVESSGSLPPGLWLSHLQADWQEPGSALKPYARQSSMGYLYPFFSSSTSADNVALPIFAAASVLRQGWWWAPASNRSISPACRAHSSKPAAAEYGERVGQTDRRADTVPLHRPCSAYYMRTVATSCLLALLHAIYSVMYARVTEQVLLVILFFSN